MLGECLALHGTSSTARTACAACAVCAVTREQRAQASACATGAPRLSKRAAGAILEDKATTDKGTVGIVSLKRIDLITAVIVDLKLTVKVRENTCGEL